MRWMLIQISTEMPKKGSFPIFHNLVDKETGKNATASEKNDTENEKDTKFDLSMGTCFANSRV